MSPIVKFKNKGFALPVAIFLLVIIALFVVSAFLINRFTQKNSIMDTLDTKAYLAAKAGLEYGLYQANKNSICLSSVQTILLPGNYLAGFKSSYTCTSQTSDENGTINTFYTINANGCNTTSSSCPAAIGKPTNEDYVEKSLTSILVK